MNGEKKVTGYRIIAIGRLHSDGEFETHVPDEMRDGSWQMWGSPFVISDVAYQAIVQYET